MLFSAKPRALEQPRVDNYIPGSLKCGAKCGAIGSIGLRSALGYILLAEIEQCHITKKDSISRE
jgi:hypothetical protein